MQPQCQARAHPRGLRSTAFPCTRVSPCAQVVTRVPSNDTYVLYQCGTAAPTPGVSAGVPLVATTFSIPLQTIAVPDTTVLGFLVGGPLEPRPPHCHLVAECAAASQAVGLPGAEGPLLKQSVPKRNHLPLAEPKWPVTKRFSESTLRWSALTPVIVALGDRPVPREQ